MDREQTATHFSLGSFERPGGRPAVPCYLLYCPSAAVTLRSQQVRALNLAWALSDSLDEKTVAVVGGGAAGLTFATVAARLGARVTLYERHTLMHMQRGAFHRPLHPEIREWPGPTAYLNAAHLPVLRWAAGTADEVATALRSQFLRDAEKLRIDLREHTSVALTPDGRVEWTASDGTSSHTDIDEPDMVVLATGFGKETNRFHVANHSYWRADSLDQSFFRNERPAILVSGGGDGALMEVFRACLESTADGALLDKLLAITLKHPKLCDDLLADHDGEWMGAEKDGKRVIGKMERIGREHPNALREMDDTLRGHKRHGVKVVWVTESSHPLDDASLPINRFIAWRLLAHAGSFGLEHHGDSKLCSVEPGLSGGYRICRRSTRASTEHECSLEAFDEVLIRWGVEKSAPALPTVLAELSDSCLWRDRLNAFLQRKPEHQTCHRPCWNDGWVKELRVAPMVVAPRLLAEVHEAIEEVSRTVFRIRIWVDGVNDKLAVRYDLHPEEEAWPVSRHGIGASHEQWLNTSNDYLVRIKTSDGHEWGEPPVTVCDALRAHDPVLARRIPRVRADGSHGEPMSIESVLELMEKDAKARGTGHFVRVRSV